MKTAILTLSLLLVATPTTAQERQGCFMVSSAGNLIDLSAICPPAPVFTEPSPEPSPVDTAAIRELAIADYATAYCQAHEDGVGDTSARELAGEAMAEQLVRTGVAVDGDLVRAASEAAGLTCGDLL